MKKIILTGLFILTLSISAIAQKFAYIDSEYILKHVPEYASAQKRIDALSAQWQQEVDAKFAEVDRLFKAFQTEEVLLSNEARKKRQEEIIIKEKEAKDFQREKFGFEGELFQRRKTLLKTVQDKVAKAVEQVAQEGLFDIIFDKATDLIMLYSSPRLDKSNDVLNKLGLKPGVFAQ